ncbi:MAG TPA: MBL fold metallo-hydrolase [Desulfobacteraceae bacterium]|nr:MBL fold metallo-hydrolase [Desulfobacteraceae bacterium]
MTDLSTLEHLDDRVSRLWNGSMYVDLVHTENGILRVGSMPDVSKAEAALGIHEEAVLIPELEASQGGDNHTGEEFVQWCAQVFGGPARRYIGTAPPLNRVYRNLDEVFSYYFDRRRLSIVKKRWLKKWVVPVPVESVYEDDPVRVRFRKGNILVYDQGREIYDREGLRPPDDPRQLVEEALGKVGRDTFSRDNLEITVVGSGNGFYGTSASFIVRFGKHVIWIDPCAQPAHSLARIGVHWDEVTDVFITHNHEDHILGFSACLQRKREKGERLTLITAQSIYDFLKFQFRSLLTDPARYIDFVEVTPAKPLFLDGFELTTRWNHHFLPYGTLGLKISAGGRVLGISGDTKFDRDINRILQREELTEAWFKKCELLFHEVDFDNPGGVHSYWKEVAAFQNVIRGRLFTYHTAHRETPPLPIADEGRVYRLD